MYFICMRFIITYVYYNFKKKKIIYIQYIDIDIVNDMYYHRCECFVLRLNRNRHYYCRIPTYRVPADIPVGV